MSSVGGLLAGLLLLGSLTVVLGLLVGASVRWPVLAFFSFGLLTLVGQWRQSVAEAGAIGLGTQVGSIWFSLLDLATVVLAISLLLIVSRAGPVEFDRAGKATLALTGLTILGLAHWVASEGLEAGTNAWRDWIYGLAFFWWGYVALRSRASGLRAALVGLGCVAALVQAFGYMSAGFVPFSSGVLIDGAYFDPRPIHAQSALLMVVGLAVLLVDDAWSRPTRLVLAGLLSFSVVISMHRSVWIAFLLVLLIEVARADAVDTQRLVPRWVVVGFSSLRYRSPSKCFEGQRPCRRRRAIPTT